MKQEILKSIKDKKSYFNFKELSITKNYAKKCIKEIFNSDDIKEALNEGLYTKKEAYQIASIRFANLVRESCIKNLIEKK